MSEINVLKILLEKLGGDSSIRELGRSFQNQTKSQIDLKRSGVKTFVEYLKLHKKHFDVYRDNLRAVDYVRVRLVPGESSTEKSPIPGINMKDFNAWQMPPPPPPPTIIRRFVQDPAPKQKIEWLKPTDFTKMEEERLKQSSPSIQSVASTDFREGAFMSSTPLPPDPDETSHSVFSYGHSESVCSSRRVRRIKSWTALELEKLKKAQQQKAEEVKIVEQSVESESDDDDASSMPGLRSVYSIGSIDDIRISEADEGEQLDRKASFESAEGESDSSDEEFENNVYDRLKSISCASLNATPCVNFDSTLCTQESTENNDEISFEAYERFENASQNTQAHSSIQEERLRPELELDTIEYESMNLGDTDATLVDPLQFIASLRPDDDFFLAKFPEVITDPSLRLEQQIVPREGEIDIFISEVYSPQNFWFQYTHDVEDLMNMLDDDYSKLRAKDLLISDERIVPGLLVACWLPDFYRWHRAQVVDDSRLTTCDEARLLIMDYGTVGNIKKHHIKYLFKKYLIFPRYSHRARFENLKPPNGEKWWNEPQVNKFLIKVSDTKLSAKILNYDEDERVFELDITLVSNNKSVNLRHWLISSWLCEPFILRPNCIYPICYYFPSFGMLEKNHPAFHEKSVLLTKGIDFDLLVDCNFFDNANEVTLPRRPKLLSMLGDRRYRHAKKYYFNV